MASDDTEKIFKTKTKLMQKCFEGDDVASKEAFARLEKLLKQAPAPKDFTPYQDPTTAACLGECEQLLKVKTELTKRKSGLDIAMTCQNPTDVWIRNNDLLYGVSDDMTLDIGCPCPWSTLISHYNMCGINTWIWGFLNVLHCGIFYRIFETTSLTYRILAIPSY